jgi:UDP-glucose 4-epimerase
VVDGVLRAATAPAATGEVINVATGTRISINQLADSLQRVLGVDIPPVHVPPRQGDVRDSLADITKARTLLGYQPLVSLDEGLRRTVDWYRAQAG